MATEKQIAANQRNARLSTGPRTLQGKARVARNPWKHGLTAQQIVLPNEKSDDLEAFADQWWADLSPVGAREEFLVERIVICAWRVRRIPLYEVALQARAQQEKLIERLKLEVAGYEESSVACLVKSVNRPHDPDAYARAKSALEAANRQLEEQPLFYATRALEDYERHLGILHRHEEMLVRSVLKMMHELERLQAQRAGRYVPPPVAVDLNVDINCGDGLTGEGEPVRAQTPQGEIKPSGAN